MALKDYVTGTTNKILVGAAGGVALIATIVAGVSLATPAYQVKDSNGLVKWAVDFRGVSTQSGVIASKTLANCNTIDGTSTGMLVCGTDATGAGGAEFGTGNVITIGDSRYVNTSGDTMTGKLLINLSSGTDALEVVGVASGRILHAQDELRSSGSLVVEGTATLNGAVNIGPGNISNDTIIEPDLSADNSPSDADILTYDSTGTNFAWITPNAGTDITADLEEETHATEHNEAGADALTVESLASSCTDAQVIGGNGAGGAECQADANTTYIAGQGLNLAGTTFTLSSSISGSLLEFQTVSGSLVYAGNTLRSSGSLVWEGAASGATLYLGGSLQGVGLTDCDTAGTSKLLWDATTGRFSCGTDTDTNTTYTAGQGLGLSSTTFSLNSSISGTLLEFQTVSGAIVHAQSQLRSSGSLSVDGTAYIRTLTSHIGATEDITISTDDDLIFSSTDDFDFAAGGLASFVANESLALEAGTTIGLTSTTGINFTNGPFIFSTGNVGISTTAPSTALEVFGTISGTTVHALSSLKSSGSLIVENNAAIQGVLTLTNALAVANGGTALTSLPTRTIILTAGGGIPSVLTGSGASGPEKYTGSTNDTSMYVLEYGNFAKARYAMWTATMPDNYDGGTMTFIFNWKTAATSNDVKWYIQCRSLGDNEAIDQSWGTAVGVADTAGTANTVRSTSATAAVTCAGTPAGGEIIQFRVYRDAADAADTLTDTGALISVKGEYLTNSYTD